ncbi:MAG: response regulator [Elusimicrobiota bacterium]
MNNKIEKNSILIVDDNQGISNACLRFLRKQKYETAAVTTRTDAKEKLSLKNYDLIIIDYTMCFDMGENFIETIKTKYPDTGFMIMSGCFSLVGKKQSLESGACHCLDKPFGINKLNNVVSAYFQSRNEQDNYKPCLISELTG